ncbi:MAG: peptidoglycan DD-metalloendopeptidase family protein [Prolixibacteraceae bacterium]|nr:peptidoglycan DD-metalloendopeptidase family protein [Prolixibacteraceae bacterium]
MKYIIGLLILFTTSSVFAQKIYTLNDSIPITQDSVTIKSGPHRGKIQWQKSLDNKSWLNLVGKTADSLKVKSDIEAMYRIKITEGACLPIYSDTAKIRLDTIQVNINNVVTAKFPVSSISTNNPKVEKLSEVDIQDIFDETQDLFKATNNISYQIKISIDILPPNNDDIEVVISVPIEYLSQLPSNYTINLFALIYQNGGDEILDNFEMIASNYISTNHTLTAKLPRWVFTNSRNGVFETVLTIAGTPENLNLKSVAGTYILLGECKSSSIICPLDLCSNNIVSSPFELGRLDPLGSGNTTTHLATDFKVPSGTNVFAVSDGEIIYKGLNTKPDSKSKTGFRGYGLYLILRHTDGSSTLYAHLSQVLISSGKVKKGDIIAKSGGSPNDYPNAGGSTGPHLHFEYVPSGNIIGSNFRIDPFPCISQASLANISTISLTNILTNSAKSGGNITSDSGTTITARGVCWSTSQDPTTATKIPATGSGIGSFTCTISGLVANTTYYVWAYAINSAGTAYGNKLSFKTSVAESGTVTDIDGNIYHTVTIGTQVWMVENLKTTKYNDGTNIPNVTDNTAWSVLTTGAYCWYNNDTSQKNTYGALYNWYSVNTGRLAPSGWHVPTDGEWATLITYLGNEEIAGGKMKETGTVHWAGDTYATNSSGFSALPGGSRYHGDGLYTNKFNIAEFWSCTNGQYGGAWERFLTFSDNSCIRYIVGEARGVSVRCVKD